METETIPEAPKILGTAKVLVVRLNTKYDRRESENLVRILVEAVLGKPYKWLLMHPEAVFSPEEFKHWNASADRLLSGEPIQYIIGKAWFRGMELAVNRHVLIPRPETEELVGWMLEKADPMVSLRILDVGTGSGCIALALAQALPLAEVTGVDISKQALELAGRNATALGLSVAFNGLDILAAEKDRFAGLDFIVSNPPYIPQTEWEELDDNVRRFEPALALRVPDQTPLIYYNKVSELARHWLKPGGWVFFEIHEAFGEAIRTSLEGWGYEHVEIRKDMSERDRMAAGQWLGSSDEGDE